MHVMTYEGKMLTGFRIREDEKTLVVRETVLGAKTYEFLKEDLEHVSNTPVSTMPKGLANQLATRAEFLDLVRFVMEAATGRFAQQNVARPPSAEAGQSRSSGASSAESSRATLKRTELFASLQQREDISFLPGKDDAPYVHIFAAEAEYGAFYSMPMMAELLNRNHDFNVSISYALDEDGNIDSRVRNGLKGFELLEHADLAVFFTRTKELTKQTSQQLQAYLDSGKPIVGFRTANHGFNFNNDDPDADYLREEGWIHKGPKLCDMWKHKFGGHHGGSPKDGDLTSISLNSGRTSTPARRSYW